MNRIEAKFRELHRKQKKAFIAFIMAGDPNVKITYQLVLELERAGVDIIELGVPFSDPTADGPVIQEASIRALKNNTNLKDILQLTKLLRKHTEIPIAILSYYNPIFYFGQERFVKLAKSCGVDGVMIVDLIPEEAGDLIKEARGVNLDTIFFVSPTTTPERIKLVDRLSRGFVYYVSLTGVTGVRETLPQDLVKNIACVRGIVKKPLCVGFGISSPNQVRLASSLCDGVIVGSAIVDEIKQNIGRRDLTKRVGKFVRTLTNVL